MKESKEDTLKLKTDEYLLAYARKNLSDMPDVLTTVDLDLLNGVRALFVNGTLPRVKNNLPLQ